MREPLMFRRGIRWAKVSGPFAGKWRVACGWRGDTSASPLNCHSWPTKAGAIVEAKGWIGDSTEHELELGRKRDAEEREADARLKQLLGAERFADMRRKGPRPRYKSK